MTHLPYILGVILVGLVVLRFLSKSNAEINQRYFPTRKELYIRPIMSILHRSKKPHTCAEICRELGKFKTLRAITVFELKPILSEMVTEEKLYAQEFAVVNGQSINSTTKYGVEPTKSSSKHHRSLNNFDWDQLLGKTRH